METRDEEVTELNDFIAETQGGNRAVGNARQGQWTEEEWRQWNAQWWRHAAASASDGNGALPAQAASGQPLDSSWGRGSYGWHGSRPEWDYGNNGKWYGKGEFGDPPAWPGWGHYRLWKKAVQRWDRNTDIAVWRRSDRLLRVLDWELQQKLEHLPEDDLASTAYLDMILQVLDVLAGEKIESEKRRKVRAALYEGGRQAHESLAEYSLRREAQFAGAAPYVSLPDDLKAIMMEEQAGLSRQGLQNLRVLTQGNANYDQVKRALRILDTEEESVMKASSKSNYFLQNDSEAADEVEDDEVSEDDVDAIFFAIEQQGMFEDDAVNFLAEWKGRKRTWAQNKELKAARKKDRRHFDGERSQRPEVRKKLSVDELKKITRCRNCQQLGHWKEDCKSPYVPRQAGSSQSGKSNRDNGSAFAFLGVAPMNTSGKCEHLWNFHGGEGCAQSFLELPPGFAVIDPGASQDLIGKKAFERLTDKLKDHGLQPVILPGDPPPASGIGGQARPLFCALTPCFLGGKPGVVKLTVLDEDIPHLISIGLLEFSKAIIDTDDNTIFFKAFNRKADMTRLESGHRIMDVGSPHGAKSLDVPSQILEEFGLKPGAFNLESSSDEAYMCCGPVSQSVGDVVLKRIFLCLFGDHEEHAVFHFDNSRIVFENIPNGNQQHVSSVASHCPWRVSWLVDQHHQVFCTTPILRISGESCMNMHMSDHDVIRLIHGFFSSEEEAMRYSAGARELCLQKTCSNKSTLRPVPEELSKDREVFDHPGHLLRQTETDLTINHGGRRTKQVSFDLLRESKVGECEGACSGGLVPSDPSSASCQQEALQLAATYPEREGDTYADGFGTMCSSTGICGKRGQSMGLLDHRSVSQS